MEKFFLIIIEDRKKENWLILEIWLMKPWWQKEQDQRLS